MKKLSKSIVFVFFMFSVCLGFSQNVFGKWKTIDDRTGKPKAIINVYKKNGLMYGQVVKVLEKGKENALCTLCKGDKKNKPVLGMTIIEGLEENEEGEWKGKTLLDPEQGSTYRCKIWLNPDNSNELKVRGYLAFVYRTQTWIRAK